MNDGDALLAAVIDRPADDFPRLAYADWLEETGDPLRAEFIRHQVALALPGWPAHALAERQFRLQRAAVIWDHHAASWLGVPGVSARLDLWRRGFLAVAECKLSVWLEHGPALARAHPLEEVRLSDKQPSHDGWWGSDVLTVGPDNLPLALWDRLPHPARRASNWKVYADVPAAISALSEACLLLVKPQPFAPRAAPVAQSPA